MAKETQSKLMRPDSEEHERKPQISPLRCAPVEMTILLQLRFCTSPGKAESYPQTELSSRPERSVVERSAVFSRAPRSDSFRQSHAGSSRFAL
jgi:hypothetical protein